MTTTRLLLSLVVVVHALLLTGAAVTASSASTSGEQLTAAAIAKRALNAPDSLLVSSSANKRLEEEEDSSAAVAAVAAVNDDPFSSSRRHLFLRSSDGARSSNSNNNNNKDGQHRQRNLLEEENASCDASFLNCITVDACATCFLEMETQDINWAGVSESTACADVVQFLNQDGHCTALEGRQDGVDAFCATFKSCVVWFDDADDDNNNNNNDGARDDDDEWFSVDCSTLTSCDWEGFHPNFLGNGVCNDAFGGCYNTAICNYDGGDCCEDTCKDDAGWVECGHDGFACRDPESTKCNWGLTNQCDASKSDPDGGGGGGGADPSKIECKDEETLYRIVMYDSFGDGWDETMMTVSPVGQTSTTVYSGGLKEGSQGTDYACLSNQPSCYHVDVKGGVWGNEISWEVKPITEGAPAIAGGGAPMECNFGVAGGACDATCAGKPNVMPSDDPGYKELKDLFKCVEDKCLIQVGACHKDAVCDKCFHADPEDYCYANNAFSAVADCTLCQCTQNTNEDFCNKKVSPGSILPPDVPPSDGGQSKKEPCTPAETIQGGTAVINFGQCIHYEQVAMMVTDFDQNNFGDIDKFESCAHSFNSDGHGGYTALGCLQILVNAMNGASSVENKDDTPMEAIKALAMSLYQDGEHFCDCTKTASEKCPMCPSFLNFKTLLYESIDACQALDEIDCDAWKEFYPPCQTNMAQAFGSVNFNKEEQCNYIRDNCGGVGPFPAFRRLDCDKEVSSEAWTFYQQYSSSCLKGQPLPSPAPAPSPSNPQPAPTPPYNPRPYNPSPSGPTPYVPPEDKGKATSKPYAPSDGKSSSDYVPAEAKKGRSWFWTIVLLGLVGGGAYYYFKRRSDGFNFIRYRGVRNTFRDDSDMYSGLALESSTNFEPPHLPPTPAAMGGMQ